MAQEVKAWEVRNQVWQEISDPVVYLERGGDVRAALEQAGYVRAAVLGPSHEVDPHFRLEIWAYSPSEPDGDGRGECYPYLVDLSVGSVHIEPIYCASLPDMIWFCGQLRPLLPPLPLHLLQFEPYAINVDAVAYTEQTRGGDVLVHFLGRADTLVLSGDEARRLRDQQDRLSDHHSV
jgi:hypothetical protein